MPLPVFEMQMLTIACVPFIFKVNGIFIALLQNIFQDQYLTCKKIFQ